MLYEGPVKLTDPIETAWAPLAPHGATPQQIASALRAGSCPPDRVFDRLLPPDLSALSQQHWTPLAVVQRAAAWFEELGVERVVDIGSGAGKFCVAAALTCGAGFLGLEQRPRLVGVARHLAESFGLGDRVRFSLGTLGEVSLPPADAYYVFNPFGEHLFGPEDRIDHTVESSDARYARDVALVEELLRSAPTGTYLLTYNGFGGRVPRNYREVRADWGLACVLRMWRKDGARTQPSESLAGLQDAA